VGVSSGGSGIFVHFCPILLMGESGFAPSFALILWWFFGGIRSLLRLSDCLIVSGSDECFPMASHSLKFTDGGIRRELSIDAHSEELL
jgi:hypothetical protein